MSLSEELRQKSREIHDISDKLINVKLIVVLTDKKLWAQALAEFYIVYRAIEDAVANWPEDPQLMPLRNLVEIAARKASFERDLEFYLGNEWSTVVKPSARAEEYCARVSHVAEEDPMLLIAYIHSMYLALLAGGQIIRRIVKKTLRLSAEDGLEIFDFKGIEIERKQLREELKSAIDTLELSRSTKDAIVAENMRCFKMNISIVKAIDIDWFSYQKIGIFVGVVVLFLAICVYLCYQF